MMMVNEVGKLSPEQSQLVFCEYNRWMSGEIKNILSGCHDFRGLFEV